MSDVSGTPARRRDQPSRHGDGKVRWEPMGSLWEGWSTDRDQVTRTQRMWQLLKPELRPGNQTGTSTGTAMVRAGATTLDTEAAGWWVRELLDEGWILNRGLDFELEMNYLFLSTKGLALRAEFINARTPRPTQQACRRAVLRWLGNGRSLPDSSWLIGEPEGWWYGEGFTQHDINEAITNLVKRDFVTAERAYSGHHAGVQLTGKGETCAESYDGDPAAMEGRAMTGQSFNFENLTNNGALAVGSQQFTQNSTVTIGQTSEDFAAMLTALRQLGWGDENEQSAAEELAGEIRAAQTDEERLSALRRAGAFFRRIYGRMSGDPAVAAFLGAAGSYAAVAAGIPPAG